MGGSADAIADVVSRGFKPGLSLAEAAKLAVRGLGSDGGASATPRVLGVEALEVAVLDRNRAMPRKFRRIKGDRLADLLADGSEATSDDGGEERQQKPAT
jgi:proteasome alpha subunit